MTYLIASVMTLLSFMIGYYVGRGKMDDEAPKKVQELIDKVTGQDLKVGALKRPTQKDLDDRLNPKIAEGKREFKKLLDTLDIKK